MTERSTIDIVDLPGYMQGSDLQEHPEEEVLVSMETVELRHLQRVLAYVEGDRKRAAEILQIGRTTLYRHLERIKKKQARETLAQPLGYSKEVAS
jgi:transcriptional regulator with PAS, ATPase and Fis domain